ncbi:conserved hypothetical protein [Planktothrix sp. PCC 11201]|uniref:hypothetical protein n=1 Tax=Planktothrix sp. PCC 11201 TaxID=1729650 RepID=UPI00091E0676|nr:hypothetical protein [Planktothrix sp. PCC 11201]SKB13350.1 conserved hypothetical protein [Planktothrix sp. PCC 11201]
MQFKKFLSKLSDPEKAHFLGVYASGTSKIEHPRKPASTELNTVNVAIIPFGISAATPVTIADYRLASITVQAIKIGKLFDANLTKFGIKLDPLTASAEAGLLKPAICRITMSSATAVPTNKVSARTSRSYKSKPTRSGSIPFGRNETVAQVTDAKDKVAETVVANIDYEDMRSTIEKLVRDTTVAGLNVSVGFKPEIWKLGKGATGKGSDFADGTFAMS